MRKTLAGATALVLGLAALAGCAGGDKGKSGSTDAATAAGTQTNEAASTTEAAGADAATLGEGHGPITFAQGKDTTGNLQGIIDNFNAAHPGEEVEFIELPESADEQRAALVQDLQAGAGTYDVLGLDVVWTAEFAARDWLLPLDGIDTTGLFASTVASGTYDGTLFAAPYKTNGALLFYRSDLIDTPPTTWAELIEDCKVAEEAGIGCYGSQFASYEGLTVGFSEAVNSAGGSIVDAQGNASVNTPEAEAGLGFIMNGFKDGYIPKAAVTYMEEESRRAFQAGELLFLRNWPYVYNLASADGEDSVVQGKFGIAPIPGKDGVGASTLGGYNIGVEKTTKNPETAKEFVAYMVSEDAQRQMITTMGEPPVLESLYDEPELQEQVPYLATLKEALESAAPRPQAVSYSEFSKIISEQIYDAIQDGADVKATLDTLQTSLQKLIDESK